MNSEVCLPFAVSEGFHRPDSQMARWPDLPITRVVTPQVKQAKPNGGRRQGKILRGFYSGRAERDSSLRLE
jgi:hypothetical protein